MSAAPTPNFDRVAAIYRWAEYLALGPLLERTRTYLLPHLSEARHALVLGDGDGRFVEQLLLRNPECTALAVDTSASMLQHLRRRCERSIANPAERLRTLQQSALTLDLPPEPENPIDLVVTHFLLDCFTQTEVEALATRLAAQLNPGTLWLVSDFALPTNPALRPLAAFYIHALYAAFRLLTGLRVTRLPNPQTALQQAGFTFITRHNLLAGLLYTELWQRR